MFMLYKKNSNNWTKTTSLDNYREYLSFFSKIKTYCSDELQLHGLYFRKLNMLLSAWHIHYAKL